MRSNHNRLAVSVADWGIYPSTANAVPLPLGEGGFYPVGKCYASIVDDEKTAFEQGRKHRYNVHKNPATSIVAAFADMDG